MIDNQELVAALLEAMKANLPIPVLPTKELQKLIRENDISLPKGHQPQIEEVVYLGDEGGIACSLTMTGKSKNALITSITHLRIHPGHCLAKEIVKYQKKRVKKLRKQHA
jgi:metal-responsive CopG/Arc/MetJ family transcriptional regulator